jgi:four helix bundle protein
MFDFENLIIYKKVKTQHRNVLQVLNSNRTIDHTTKDQLRRASLSTILNIAEGSGKFSKADKRYFYTNSRGSTYECVAIFDILKEEGKISEVEYSKIYISYQEISKMLLGLINSQK